MVPDVLLGPCPEDLIRTIFNAEYYPISSTLLSRRSMRFTQVGAGEDRSSFHDIEPLERLLTGASLVNRQHLAIARHTTAQALYRFFFAFIKRCRRHDGFEFQSGLAGN